MRTINFTKTFPFKPIDIKDDSLIPMYSVGFMDISDIDLEDTTDLTVAYMRSGLICKLDHYEIHTKQPPESPRKGF